MLLVLSLLSTAAPVFGKRPQYPAGDLRMTKLLGSVTLSVLNSTDLGGIDVTLIWFVTWLIANNVGGHEPLLLNPVNAWVGTLILAVALDLSRSAVLPRRGE
jgi:hypothetical protein